MSTCDCLLSLKLEIKVRMINQQPALHMYMVIFVATFFFLNDLFLYLAIDTVFHPSGIIQNGRRKLLQNHMFKVLIT